MVAVATRGSHVIDVICTDEDHERSKVLIFSRTCISLVKRKKSTKHTYKG
jgi:hypothetical protein